MRALAVCRSVALRCQQKAVIAADAGRSYEAVLKQLEVYRCASRDDSQVKNIQDSQQSSQKSLSQQVSPQGHTVLQVAL